MTPTTIRPRCFLLLIAFALTATASSIFAAPPAATVSTSIDRHALVTRHNPVNRAVDADEPLTVGNGNFAFGCDITGMQTLAAFHHRNGIPVEILSRWSWVSDPNTRNFTLADASKTFTQANGKTIALPSRQSTPAGQWLRENPRNHPLAQLALDYTRPDGTNVPLAPADIGAPEQTLDLWSGIVTSRFTLDGVAVRVETACDPDSDTVALRIESDLVATGKLRARLAFPRGHNLKIKNTPGLDWTQPGAHISTLNNDATVVERHILDATYYVVSSRPLTLAENTPHTFFVNADKASRTLRFTLNFTPKPPSEPENNCLVFEDSAEHWENFWNETAAVDFSGSTNPLAPQIERRIILSLYLMAVQMAGDTPPQETGLTCSTWYGKHHTEMIWWHTAHFPLWGSDNLLQKNLTWFQSQLPVARALAKERGLTGARWAKMTGPDMRESPGGNPLIVWNQPHLVYLCELLYRNNPTPETLARYRDLVLETADCMASMLFLDTKRGQRGGEGEYVLGPPLWIAQEIYDQATSQNPSYELAYWRWALLVAQQWRERLDLPREKKWDHIVAHLSPIPQKNGLYVALESTPDTWDNIASRHDHPTMLAPLGVLPGNGPDVDRATMNRTLDAVLTRWDWDTKIWGWDYPMIAMTATRLGRPADALAILMRDGPNNRYLSNGHCPQRVDEKLSAAAQQKPDYRRREIATYLPANGAFLSAIALMVSGWDDCKIEQPGFPKDGTWKIRAEGLHRLP